MNKKIRIILKIKYIYTILIVNKIINFIILYSTYNDNK